MGRELPDGEGELLGAELELHRVEKLAGGDEAGRPHGIEMVEGDVERVPGVPLVEGDAAPVAAEGVEVPVVGLAEGGAALCVLGTVLEMATAPGAIGRVVAGGWGGGRVLEGPLPSHNGCMPAGTSGYGEVCLSVVWEGVVNGIENE